MTKHPSDYTATDLSNPNIDIDTLESIAEVRSDLWLAIANHPNCSSELKDRIKELLAPAASTQPARSPGESPLALTHRGNGDELNGGVSHSESDEDDQIPDDTHGQTPFLQRMEAVEDRVEDDAKSLLESREHVPAVGTLSGHKAGRVGKKRGEEISTMRNSASWVMIIASLLTIISLFLPLLSEAGMTVYLRFRPDESESEPKLLLFFFVVVLVFSILSLILHRRWLRITAAILGILAGFGGAVDGLGMMERIAGRPGAVVGLGVVCLVIFSVVLFIASIVTLFPQKKK